METPTPPPLNPADLPATKRKWNSTIGIITLIFGILGLLGALMAPFSLLFTKKVMEPMAKQGANAAEISNYLAELTSLSIISTIGMAILAILLTIGGIMLMKARAISSPLLQVWSVLKIAFGAFVSFKNYGLTEQQMRIQNSIAGIEAEAAQTVESITTIAVLIGAILGAVWIAVLPVFLLIWLNRAAIKTDISNWNH